MIKKRKYRIKEMATQNGRTLKWLAEQIGLHHSTMRRFASMRANEKTEIKKPVLISISNIFNCSIEDLLNK